MRNGNKKFHLSWKHGIALLLAVVLFMTMIMPSALGSEGGGTTPPKITVVSTVIDGDTRTVEVGLSINSASQLFQSAGVLLKYDSNVLTLIDWDTETTANDVTLNGAAPVAVPSKGAGKAADEAAGKMAEASVNDGTNYLFLSSEMLKAKAIAQTLPTADDHSADPTNYPVTTAGGKTVTYTDAADQPTDQTVVVRFRVNDGNPETDTPKTLAALVGALDVVGVTTGNIEAVKTFPLSKVLATADAVNYFADNADHTTAGLTSSSDVAFHWIAEGVTANSGAGGGYSVLFNLMGGKAIIQENKAANPGTDPDQWEDKTTDPDVTGTLFAAIPSVREGAEVALPIQTLGANERLIFRVGTREFTTMNFVGTDGETYTYGAEDGWKISSMPENGIALTAQVPADASQFLIITGTDWCGVEILGSTAVPKVADATEQQALIDEALKKFAVSLMSDEDAAAYQAAGFDPATCTDHPAEGKPLSNKPGYTFSTWIPFDAEFVSSYGKAVPVTDASLPCVDIPKPTGFQFDAAADYSTGIIVKAAYCANASMTTAASATAADRVYSISAPASGFTRFEGTENYSITFTIKRENAAGQPVPRVRKLGLRVALLMEGQTAPVFMLQELDNQDEVTTIVAVSSKVTSVSAQVIDLCDDTAMGGTINWATGASSRSATSENKTGTGHGRDAGFIILGNVGFVNEQLRAAAMMDTPTTDALTFTRAHMNGMDATAFDNLSGGAGAKLRNTKSRLLAMFLSLPDEMKAEGLTWDDMQEAIQNQTVWAPAGDASGGWTNGYTGTFAG